ncbi:MAG: hypothetical protein ACYCVY_08215 [Acidiferrobacteraceae bacterium]
MMHLDTLNLWNPRAGIDFGAALLTAFVLGMIHGITPDEHTWPITFSYSIGSYSTRGGMRAGLLFSLAFTLQRAIASEIAYVGITAFDRLVNAPRFNFYVYLVVGTVMFVSGYYVLRRGSILHLFHRHPISYPAKVAEPRPAPAYMPLVHGFIAGWGSGAFALIVYTVLAPAMPSATWGFMPGLLFGVGTMVTQILFGALFGAWMARRHLPEEVRTYVARMVAGRTLTWSGLSFVLIALLGLLDPGIGALQISTGIRVHNLAHLGIGFFLSVIILCIVAIYAFIRSLHEARMWQDRLTRPHESLKDS